MRTLPRAALSLACAALLSATAISPALAHPGHDTTDTNSSVLDTSNLDALKAMDILRFDDNGAVIPWGANDWSCTPSAAHPNPVVLVHGYMASATTTWLLLAPALKVAGYCVYTLNWGQEKPQPLYGYGALRESAKDLGAFIDKVLASTKAKKVDIVGHSAGGVMPRWYMNKLGGGDKVGKFFAVAPATNGTDFGGIITTFPTISNLVVEAVSKTLQPGLRDFMPGSDFIKEVNTPSPTLPNIKYYVLATKADTTVTPVDSQFLPAAPNVTNVLLEDVCPDVSTAHATIPFNYAFIQMVENFLGNQQKPIVCSITG